MTGFIAWCGFFGGWLLVAGPVFQAALELREEAFEREEFERVVSNVERPKPVSAWWWIVPPVYYLASRRRSRQHREAILQKLSTQQLDQILSYLSKARGWLIVGMGALLIATKETWELCEHYEWTKPVFLVIWIVSALLAFGATGYRMKRDAETRAAFTGEAD